MGRSVIVITVDGNQYKIEKNGISDFALIGVLECVISDLKSNRQNIELTPVLKETPVEEKSEPTIEKVIEVSPINQNAILETPIDLTNQKDETSSKQENTTTTDIRNRIINARKAIRDLKGEVEETNLTTMTNEELQIEFDELTAQYKRLKNSQSAAKTPRK